jgi:hypothetical protein
MRALRGLALSALCWRWWAIAALLELALALPAALYWRQWLDGALANRYEPGELFANLSTSFRFDHRAQIDALQSDASIWLGCAALLSMLLGVFFAGGWAQLACDGEDGRVVARAGAGARRFFWRYVRIWLLTLVLLSVWSWMLFEWPWKKLVLDTILKLPEASGDRLEALTSEWSAVAVRLVQAVIYALGVALLLCCADYARLRLAWKDRRSALFAWIGAAAMLAGSPRRTLGPLAAIFLVEVALVAAASWFARGFEGRIGVQEAGLGAVGVLAATTVALAFLRCWLRGAKYLAAGEVVREAGARGA